MISRFPQSLDGVHNLLSRGLRTLSCFLCIRYILWGLFFFVFREIVLDVDSQQKPVVHNLGPFQAAKEEKNPGGQSTQWPINFMCTESEASMYADILLHSHRVRDRRKIKIRTLEAIIRPQAGRTIIMVARWDFYANPKHIFSWSSMNFSQTGFTEYFPRARCDTLYLDSFLTALWAKYYYYLYFTNEKLTQRGK